ncbi:hypothetical protein BGZ83_004856 [Gryganskiella cystojenkinii]|nr:hypothetical protein BGZ83_004856 [Gryganskiella cystojenkinii]
MDEVRAATQKVEDDIRRQNSTRDEFDRADTDNGHQLVPIIHHKGVPQIQSGPAENKLIRVHVAVATNNEFVKDLMVVPHDFLNDLIKRVGVELGRGERSLQMLLNGATSQGPFEYAQEEAKKIL